MQTYDLMDMYVRMYVHCLMRGGKTIVLVA